MLNKLHLVWIVLLSGCASMQITSDYDSAADFGRLQSYDWLPAPETKLEDKEIKLDAQVEQQVRTAIGTKFAEKGFAREAQQPDFLVTYHVAVDQKVSVSYMNELYGYGPGWGPAYRRRLLHDGYPSREAVVSEYRQGTLIIDVVRASDKQLIWRGTASDEVSPDSTRETRERRLREAVNKILSLFPPPKE